MGRVLGGWCNVDDYAGEDMLWMSFSGIAYGIVQNGLEGCVESEEAYEGFAVHGAPGDGCQSGCSAEDIDIFAGDACIGTHHAHSLFTLHSKALGVGHHDDECRGLGKGLLTRCHECAVVSVGDVLEHVVFGQIAVTAFCGDEEEEDFLTVHGRR